MEDGVGFVWAKTLNSAQAVALAVAVLIKMNPNIPLESTLMPIPSPQAAIGPSAAHRWHRQRAAVGCSRRTADTNVRPLAGGPLEAADRDPLLDQWRTIVETMSHFDNGPPLAHHRLSLGCR